MSQPATENGERFTIRWEQYAGSSGGGAYRVSIPNYDGGEVVAAEKYDAAIAALRVADDLLRQFSISAADHSELIRREFGKAQAQINAHLSASTDSGQA
jgi:hypothetical protein